MLKRFTLYVNKKRNKKFTLKKRDTVYLLRRNIKTKRLSNKLNYTKLESFKVLKKKKLVNYRLKLLVIMKIHLIFYISLLEFADSNTLI